MLKFTFGDYFLHCYLVSSNAEHSSYEAAAAAGTTSASTTGSRTRPGTRKLPTRIKKFFHFRRLYPEYSLVCSFFFFFLSRKKQTNT